MIAIFGAGIRGKRLKNRFDFFCKIFSANMKDVVFTDNNEELWDTELDGTKIITPAQLSAIKSDISAVIIASSWVIEIFEQLRGMGFAEILMLDSHDQIVTVDDEQIALETEKRKEAEKRRQQREEERIKREEERIRKEEERIKREEEEKIKREAERIKREEEKIKKEEERIRKEEERIKREEERAAANKKREEVIKANYINKIYSYTVAAHSFIRDFFGDGVRIFKTIEIETINKCNGDCHFCPVNKHVDTRNHQTMTEEMFDSILRQLAELNYTGHVNLYSNNEPFMDKRILSFMEKTKRALPNATKLIFTNGTLMSMDDFKKALVFLDYILIDAYSMDYSLEPNIAEIYDYCLENPDIVGDKVKIIKKRKDAVLSSRGGQAPNKGRVELKNTTCLLPFQQFVVRPDGGVSLCCNDALGKFTLGNVSNDKIIDIWRGELYQEIRETLASGREHISLCSGCDTIFEVYEDKRWENIFDNKGLLNIY